MISLQRGNVRRALAAAVVGVAAATALSACMTATDRLNDIANGGYSVTPTGLRVLATKIVAGQDNAGVFIATITLNPTQDAATSASNPSLLSIAKGPDAPTQQGSTDTITAGPHDAIEIAPSGSTNLGDPAVGGIPVTGSFKAGDIIPITLSFSDGSTVTVQTPVVTRCDTYADVVAQGTPTDAPPAPAGEGAYDCTYPSPLPASAE